MPAWNHRNRVRAKTARLPNYLAWMSILSPVDGGNYLVAKSNEQGFVRWEADARRSKTNAGGHREDRRTDKT